MVARFADGTLAFREPLRIPRNGQRQLVGEYRDTLQYLIQSPAQSPRPVARLLDAEMNRSVRGTNRSESTVIFGHLSLSTQAGQHLALTQTDMGVVQILDRSGAQVGTVPLPSGAAIPGTCRCSPGTRSWYGTTDMARSATSIRPGHC